MAEDLGRLLGGEVEVVGFGELLHTLRLQTNGNEATTFAFPPLDRLLQIADENLPQTRKASHKTTLVELMSLAPDNGATHLLYHLCMQAILPADVGGKNACAVLIDADGTFSVPHLAKQLQLVLERRYVDKAVVDSTIHHLLKHVHIFRPRNLASTVATIDSLPAYLFDADRHYSFDRAVAFIAIHSASTFYWQDRLEVEDAQILSPGESRPSGYVALASSLQTACRALDCPGIVSRWHLGPGPAHSQNASTRSFRPALPGFSPTLRLVVQRVPVRKFPPGISVEDARREAEDRQRAVDEGKFECFVNESGGSSERVRMRLEEAGFGFRIRGGGELEMM